MTSPEPGRNLMRATAFPARWPVRTMAPLLMVLAAIGLLALLPTARAHASAPAVTVPPTEGVEKALGETPLGALPAEQLAEAISGLDGLEAPEPEKLAETIQKLLAHLTEGTTLGELLGGEQSTQALTEKLEVLLGPLASKLEELLGVNPVTKLSEALQSAGVEELLGMLLAASKEPQALIGTILQSLSPETLQGLLGTLPSGGPFSASTVEELAGKLGTTPEALAGELGRTAEQLPSKAMALTGPLANGETLAVLNGLGGITLGLVKETGETVGLTGGTGGPGGAGGSGPGAGGTTSPPPGAAASTTRRLRLISHRVKGRTATVVVEVPAAGTLTAGGRNLRSIRRQTAKAERVTLHPALTRRASAALRRHRRNTKAPFKVSFTPVGGAPSSVSVTLGYR